MQAPPVFDQDTGLELYHALRKQRVKRGETLVLDLSETERMDTRGGARMLEMADHVRRRGGQFAWEGAQGEVAEFIEIIGPALQPGQGATRSHPGSFEEIGEKAIKWAGETREFVELCIDACYWTLIAPFEGRGFRWGLLLDEMYEMGVRAVRIVCLMNFLLGLIIAMLSSAQVAAFGLSIYVADLIMIGFARELAAIMTCTVISARTGAAITAELATMKVQEEIDALRGMGLNVTQFLVAPKLLALVIVLPCLVALGLLSGLAGGMAWGVFFLGFRPSVWLQQTLNAAALGDLMQGFLKTFFFALSIALIGCHNGLRVTGGSRGVGLMTTRSVVMDIFTMITIDIIFASVFYYLL